MNFSFELNVIKEKKLAFLKIESHTEEFYRKIINMIDHSYKKYEGIIFRAMSESHIVVIELYLKYFLNKENKIAENVKDLLDNNAKNFIIEMFDNEEQIKMFFRRLSKNNQK